MTNALQEDVLYADHSYISTAADCARKAYWSYELGIEPRQQSVSRHLGKVIHAGVHHLHMTDFDLDGAIEVVREAYGSFVCPPGDHRTLGFAEIVLRNYHEDRQGDAILPLKLKLTDLLHENIEAFDPHVDKDGVVHFAETPLAAWLDDETCYAGLIDLPATIHGPTYIVDHKTTSWWASEKSAREYADSFQLKGYAALLEAVTGIRPAGYYVNFIYTGKEAADDKEKWKKRSSVRSGLFGPYTVKPHEGEALKEWIAGWLQTIEYYRQQQEKMQRDGHRPERAWPMNTGACNKYGGCAFKELCHSSPVMRDGLIRMKYREKDLTGILASGADSD